jgi:transcriptional repressor NrdR
VHCPRCQADDTKVADSRLAGEGSAVRRRRRCPSCDYRFTTYERVDEAAEVPLRVIKSSGAIEPFDRHKVASGVQAAAKGRHIGADQLDQLVEAVEEASRLHGAEVSSAQIGATVLNLLGSIDEVAYLRFASVYKNFDAAADFHREIELLGKLGVGSG